MTLRLLLPFALLLAACAGPMDCKERAAPVGELQACPAGANPPAPAPVPRTVEQVGVYAMRLERARAATERARAECARLLDRLNAQLAGGEPRGER
jgi:hypothetical protein